MKRTNRNLSIAAVASLVALGGPGVAALASSPSSTAQIDLTSDCVVESTKDISYVETLSEGASLAKVEDVDAPSYDLAAVEGLEGADAVRVKSGTTVEELALSGCAPVDSLAPVQIATVDDETDDTEEGEPEESDDTDADDPEESDPEETEHADLESETDAEADEDAAGSEDAASPQPAPVQAQGHHGHGENDDRHDGRHEKWAGSSTDEVEPEESDDTHEDDGEDTDESDDRDEGTDEDDGEGTDESEGTDGDDGEDTEESDDE